MKAKHLTIALAASVFAIVSCKPKAETTEEKVSAGSEKISEGINEMIETSVDEAEPAEAGPQAVPSQATGAALGAATGAVLEQAPAEEEPTPPAQ